MTNQNNTIGTTSTTFRHNPEEDSRLTAVEDRVSILEAQYKALKNRYEELVRRK